MGKQEILPPDPPQRDRNGQFAPGHAGVGGRPQGSAAPHTKAIKDMVREALERVGGVDYLAMCALTQPVAFLGLVGKTMPLKLADEDGAPISLVVVKKTYVHVKVE